MAHRRSRMHMALRSLYTRYISVVPFMFLALAGMTEQDPLLEQASETWNNRERRPGYRDLWAAFGHMGGFERRVHGTSLCCCKPCTSNGEGREWVFDNPIH